MGRLQTGRLENLIRRWGSIKGGGSVLSETLGDVFPILDLENLPPELLLTAGISMIAGTGTVTGGVGQLGAVQLVNPTGTNAILTLTKFHVKTAAVQGIACGLTTDLLSPLINSRNMDSRSAVTFNAAARIAVSANAAGSLGDFVVDTEATIDREVTIPHGIAVITPGNAFRLTASATNTLLRVSFFGYVRQAEPSELSF